MYSLSPLSSLSSLSLSSLLRPSMPLPTAMLDLMYGSGHTWLRATDSRDYFRNIDLPINLSALVTSLMKMFTRNTILLLSSLWVF